MKKKGIIILSKDLTERWLDIIKRANLNTVGLHCLYLDGGIDAHLEWLKKPETTVLINKFYENGIDVEHQIHAVGWLLPRSLFSTHQNWFRVNDKGERVGDWNFCVSNDEALRYIEDSSYDLAKRLKQRSHSYYIWSDDVLNSICYCEKCKKYNGADQNMIIMEHVLKGIKGYDSKARLSFLAYQDSNAIPTLPPVKDMFLEFAPISRNHFSPMNGTDENNIKSVSSLERFLKIFPDESTEILEYFFDVSLFCQWKREDAKNIELNIEQLENDIKFYALHNVGGIHTFAAFMDDKWLDKYGDDSIIRYGKVLDKYFQ